MDGCFADSCIQSEGREWGWVVLFPASSKGVLGVLVRRLWRRIRRHDARQFAMPRIMFAIPSGTKQLSSISYIISTCVRTSLRLSHPFLYNRSNDDGNFTLATVDTYVSAANPDHSVQAMWDFCLYRLLYPARDNLKCEGLRPRNTLESGCLTHDTVPPQPEALTSSDK